MGESQLRDLGMLLHQARASELHQDVDVLPAYLDTRVRLHQIVISWDLVYPELKLRRCQVGEGAIPEEYKRLFKQLSLPVALSMLRDPVIIQKRFKSTLFGISRIYA